MTYPEQPPRLPDAHLDAPQPDERVEGSAQVPSIDVSPADDRGRLELDHPLGSWQRISPRYAIIEQIGNAVAMIIVAAITALLWFFRESPWVLAAGGAVLIILIITAILIPRRARSIGYLLREDDLLFRRGIMWQRFVAVPYGRMQLVDINRGPVARAFGLAELKFVTAAVGTNVVIPGLPLEEAERLRDHLVAVAESRRSGL